VVALGQRGWREREERRVAAQEKREGDRGIDYFFA
jgi:hypothetical protein